MEEGKIDVSDIESAELLAGLYNRSHPQGMGFLQAHGDDMTTEQAATLLDNGDRSPGTVYFDYLQGRVMKVEINGATLETWLYDRDLGIGAAQAVVDSIRSQKAA